MNMVQITLQNMNKNDFVVKLFSQEHTNSESLCIKWKCTDVLFILPIASFRLNEIFREAFFSFHIVNHVKSK